MSILYFIVLEHFISKFLFVGGVLVHICNSSTWEVAAEPA